MLRRHRFCLIRSVMALITHQRSECQQVQMEFVSTVKMFVQYFGAD